MRVMDAFFNKIDKSGDCWIWTAGKDKDGYGKLTSNGRCYQAHRLSWEIHKGPIPKGALICHKCDNPPCVNPSHLFVGTYLDNNRDRDSKGRNGYSKKTHCPHGHEYSVENTKWWKNTRQCKICSRKRRISQKE